MFMDLRFLAGHYAYTISSICHLKKVEQSVQGKSSSKDIACLLGISNYTSFQGDFLYSISGPFKRKPLLSCEYAVYFCTHTVNPYNRFSYQVTNFRSPTEPCQGQGTSLIGLPGRIITRCRLRSGDGSLPP